MPRRALFVALIALIGAATTAKAQAQSHTVAGRVLGQEGRPMVQAHVKLTTAYGDELKVQRTAADGTFRLQVDSSGVYRLLTSGVDHRAEVVPLFLDETTGTVELDVRLGRLAYRDDLSKAAVVGGFNHYSYRRGEIDLEPQADGTLGAMIPVEADTLAYQLIHAAQGTSDPVNGARADRYQYDYAGSYRSIVDVVDGFVRIVIDPHTAPPSRPAKVTFADEEGAAARFASLTGVLDALGEQYDRGFRALRQRRAGDEEVEQYFDTFDWSPGADALQRALEGIDASALQDVLYAAYFTRVLRPDSLIAMRALRQVAPASSAWSAAPTALGRALDAAPDGVARRYRRQVIQKHRSADVRAFLLYEQLVAGLEAGDLEAVRAAHAELTSSYPGHRYTGLARSRYAPDRPAQVGQPVPSFSIEALQEEGERYTEASFAGRPVLLDFWATWCAPCIGEMPFLHAAYERFGPHGLQILSLSFDRSPRDVEAFREVEWPMPWRHAFVEGGFRSDLAETFAIDGIPAPILVGPDGTILAAGMALRGELLEETLERHLLD